MIRQLLKRAKSWLRGEGILQRTSLAAMHEQRAMHFEIRSDVNHRWPVEHRGNLISHPPMGLIDEDTKIFAMGSCFAEQIRRVMRAKGVAVLPKYGDVPLDRQRQLIGTSLENVTINHYDTFTIRQEFEKAFAGEMTSAEQVCRKRSRSTNPFGEAEMFVDPFRKNVCGLSAADSLDVCHKVDQCLRDAIEHADVYIITLGLIECWYHRVWNKYVWGAGMARKTEISDDLEFRHSTFAENYENMRRVCDLVLSRYPQRHIILTVSPVALHETYSGNDVVVANLESKSVLRGVAGQITREFANVHYWPSYEIATRQDVFQENGRHVSEEGANFIVENFLRVYMKPPQSYVTPAAA